MRHHRHRSRHGASPSGFMSNVARLDYHPEVRLSSRFNAEPHFPRWPSTLRGQRVIPPFTHPERLENAALIMFMLLKLIFRGIPLPGGRGEQGWSHLPAAATPSVLVGFL